MLKLIVDENIPEGSPLLAGFLMKSPTGQRPGLVCEFLALTRPGIPDVEILTKVLNSQTILFTKDRVLHNQALALKFRSVYTDEQGRFTEGRLAGISPKPLPKTAYDTLQSEYLPKTHPMAGLFWNGMSEKRIEGYRKSRRRMRSQMGSAEAIREVSVCIGRLDTKRGMLCGFAVWLYSHDPNAAKLRATEGYYHAPVGKSDPAAQIIVALRELIFLHLGQTVIRLYVVDPMGLELTLRLKSTDVAPKPPLEQVLHALLHSFPTLSVLPCVKGPPYEAMKKKLADLAKFTSNEIQPLDVAGFAAIAGELEVPSST